MGNRVAPANAIENAGILSDKRAAPRLASGESRRGRDQLERCGTAHDGLHICGRRPTWDRCFASVARWTVSPIRWRVRGLGAGEIGQT